MKKLTLFLLLPFLVLSLFHPKAFAAQIIDQDNATISSDAANLEDLYLFGGNIRMEAPVINDLTAAGGTLNLQGSTTGSVLAAGGNLTIGTAIGNTLRAAGGNLLIDSTIARDAVVAGGQIHLTDQARVTRDLLIFGGQIVIDAPVGGKIIANGGDVFINSTVGGNVEGNIGTLRIGSNAVITGDLSYQSSERAVIDPGAQILGEHRFTQVEGAEHAEGGLQALVTAGTIYKLIIDILVGLFFIYLFRRLLDSLFVQTAKSPLKTLGTGFAVVILMPIASLFMLVLFLLGVISFALYFLLLLVSIVVGKVLVGWFLVRLWEKRQGGNYALDYKATIVGPIAMFLLYLIPIIGWLAAAIIYFIAVGTVFRGLLSFVSTQRTTSQGKKK